jgi:hypothetical protein
MLIGRGQLFLELFHQADAFLKVRAACRKIRNRFWCITSSTVSFGCPFLFVQYALSYHSLCPLIAQLALFTLYSLTLPLVSLALLSSSSLLQQQPKQTHWLRTRAPRVFWGATTLPSLRGLRSHCDPRGTPRVVPTSRRATGGRSLGSVSVCRGQCSLFSPTRSWPSTSSPRQNERVWA